VRRSHEIWREIEAQLDGALRVRPGTELMLTCGGLVIGPRSGGGELHGAGNFVLRTIAVAREQGIAHEALDADTVCERFPQFVLRGDEIACFEPGAGVLRPERCIAAQLELAKRTGAQVLLGEVVTAISGTGSGVAVTSGGVTHHAARAIQSAGAWNPALATGRFATELRVRRQTLHWFRAVDSQAMRAYAPDTCPIFIWSHGATPDDAFYGIPAADEHRAVKVGTQQHMVDTEPDTLNREVTQAESEAVHRRHVQGRLGGLSAQRVHAAACLYTVAQDARFVIDRHPRVEHALVVSACSGHGFKHSAAIGEAAAHWVLGTRSEIDLGQFAWR